jgi:hypothetical protein
MQCNERLTLRDHGPTEHGRDASALQLHLKDPESSLSSSLSSPHTMPWAPPEHYISLSALPNLPKASSLILSHKPDEPDDGQSIRHK